MTNDASAAAESWLESLRRSARVWRGCLSLAIVREAQFRSHFITSIVVGLVQIVLGLVPIFVLYDHAATVRGWSQADMIVVLGMHQAMMGMHGVFISNNMWSMTNNVSKGMLDQMLIRPIDAQFYVATRWIRPEQVFVVVSGAAVVTMGLASGRGIPGPESMAQGIILFLAGFVLITCFAMALGYLAFWMESIQALTFMFRNEIMDAGRFPVGFFPFAMRVALTFAIPLGFATTFPAEAITHGISWWVVIGAVAFAALAVAALRRFWIIAVRRYSSASS